MDRPIRILHLEDNRADAELIHQIISQQDVDCEIKLVTSRAEFEEAFAAANYDVILCDYGLPSYTGLNALALVRGREPDLPFVLLSGTLGEEQAVESLKMGANDYILKNHLHRLGPAITRAVQEYDEKVSRRRADEALRLNEERLSCVLRAANDAVWDWDIRADSIWWNQGLHQIFGIVPSGRKFDLPWWIQAIHPEDRKRVAASKEAAILSNRQTWTEEYRFRCGDSSYAFVFDRGFILRDAMGNAVRMIGSMMDISDRRRAEEQIRRQAQLLDQTHDAILVCSLDQRIDFWNAGAARLYGWTAGEVVGKRADELFYQDADQVLASQAVLEKGEWTGELKQMTKTGRQIIVASRRTLLRDVSGNPAGILSINTDVTEQKKLEVQFLQAQRLECVGSLAGGIAHDLNNMLAPILMAADMIRDQVANTEDAQMVDLIVTSAHRGADLVKQILAFSKGAASLRTVFNPRHVINDVVKVLRATLPKEIQISVECPSNLHDVEGDPTQIHQVLMNLCINARDAMPTGGSLRVSGGNVQMQETDQKAEVWFRVEDSGTGIPQEILTRIFDPFFTTKDPGKGTGLGLATVKKIVAAHGGRVEVKSTSGQGSAFTVCLPASLGPRKAEEASPAGLPRGQGETILVVDDEAALREILKTTLETYGYNVQVVNNGIEALTLFKQRSFEMVLTDMNMPGMGGAQLVKQAAELKPDTVFILMSGVLEKEALQSIEDQPKVILQKPFSTASLLKALRQALEGRKRPGPVLRSVQAA